jgi:hypothetical protein
VRILHPQLATSELGQQCIAQGGKGKSFLGIGLLTCQQWNNKILESLDNIDGRYYNRQTMNVISIKCRNRRASIERCEI